MDDLITVEQVPQEELTKEQLIKQIEELDAYIQQLEAEGKKKTEHINKQHEEFDKFAKKTEHLIRTQRDHYESLIQSIFTIVKSAENLLSQADYSGGEE